ncbi:Protein of unknown function [Gryllus bimaculatus]|nr:Protein of unknown function [Gryllus bimaculatus]
MDTQRLRAGVCGRSPVMRLPSGTDTLLLPDQLLLDVCGRSLPLHARCGNIHQRKDQVACLPHYWLG